MNSIEREQKEITDGLESLLTGKNKRLTIVAALSIATTTAFQIRATKEEIQALFDRLWKSKIAQ